MFEKVNKQVNKVKIPFHLTLLNKIVKHAIMNIHRKSAF